MRVVYRQLALADLDHIFRYLNERSPAGARIVAAAKVYVKHAVDIEVRKAASEVPNPNIRTVIMIEHLNHPDVLATEISIAIGVLGGLFHGSFRKAAHPLIGANVETKAHFLDTLD
jgi:hypothetical protein